MSQPRTVTVRADGRALEIDGGPSRVSPKAIFGDFGTVTQQTNNSTGVTLNAPTGKIIMFNGTSGTLANGAGASFVLTNSCIQTSSGIILTTQSSTGTAAATRQPVIAGVEDVTSLGDGSCTIHVYNPDAATTTDAPVIYFQILNPKLG
jgi:hypothetical protein